MNPGVSLHHARVNADTRIMYDLYCLADASVQFRYSIERNYLGGAEGDSERPRPVPSSVSDWDGEIRRSGALTAPALTGVAETAVRDLMQAATAVMDTFRRTWDSAEHEERLMRLREEQSDVHSDQPAEYRMISQSPVGPAAWTGYEATIAQLARTLTPPLSDFFTLSHTLAVTAYPTFAEYDLTTHTWPAYSSQYVLETISPRVTLLLRAISDRTGLLTALPNPITAATGPNPDRTVRPLHEEIRRRLEHAAARVSGPPSGPPASEAAVAPVPCSSAEYHRLLAIKLKIDPDERYVGRSVAILRVFDQIDRLNQRPDQPVVLYGPSRVGKTAVARLVHDSSDRARKPFLRLSASSVRATDEGVRQSRWAGVGRNSLIAGARLDTQTNGWLAEATGGAIFIDELQDLDEGTQQFLRQVFDRMPIPRAAGDGEPVIPDVRLVFATNRPLEELVQEGKLRRDFVNRLRGRVLDIPSLDERKEDIPLFVKKFGPGHKPTMRFLLCLFRHSWEVGQVETLQEAIETAADVAGPNGNLTDESLWKVPSLRQTVGAVQTIPEADAEREVIHMLIESLTIQGYQPGVPRSGLGRRLAEILGVSGSTVTRLLRRNGCGVGPDEVGAESDPINGTLPQTGCDGSTDSVSE